MAAKNAGKASVHSAWRALVQVDDRGPVVPNDSLMSARRFSGGTSAVVGRRLGGGFRWTAIAVNG